MYNFQFGTKKFFLYYFLFFLLISITLIFLLDSAERFLIFLLFSRSFFASLSLLFSSLLFFSLPPLSINRHNHEGSNRLTSLPLSLFLSLFFLYSMNPDSWRFFFKIISLHAPKTTRTLRVSVAHVTFKKSSE